MGKCYGYGSGIESFESFAALGVVYIFLKIFEHHEAVDKYAEAHGLAYVWEGTTAFEKRRRTLSPAQYEILAVQSPWGVTRVLLFSKEIARAEAKALSERLAKRKARYQKPP